MSVGIRLNVFEIVIIPRSEIRFYRSKFLVSDLDEYYHFKVLKISFGYCKSKLQAFEVGKKIITSQLPLTNFRRFNYPQNNFQKSCKIEYFFPHKNFSRKIFQDFFRNFQTISKKIKE